MKPNTLGLITLAVATATAATVIAAERRVMFEQFTASWCTPCQAVGYALADLTDENPDAMQSIQKHIWSSAVGYDAVWCESRATFYGVGGIPTVQIDGVIKRVGSAGQAADYNAFSSYLNQRLNVPSDVSITLTGEELSNTQYRVTMDIAVDAGAPSRSMVVHCYMSVDAECGYPGAGFYYDTHFDHFVPQTITLAGGQSTSIQKVFALNSTASSNVDFISFSCFTQEPGSNGSGNNLDVYNMGFMDYGSRPPETIIVGNGGDFETIQDALDYSISGDTILVEAGTYFETIDFDGVSCTLKSMSGATNTIIDADEADAVVSMLGGGSATIEGFTLQNGYSSLGSGLRTNGSPTVRACEFRNNVATSNYVIFSTGNVTVENNYFCGNSPNTIGGNYTDGGGNSFEEDCPGFPCPGDLDNDGIVGVNDVLFLISAWGGPDGDINGDGTTDVNDLLELISYYGTSC